MHKGSGKVLDLLLLVHTLKDLGQHATSVSYLGIMQENVQPKDLFFPSLNLADLLEEGVGGVDHLEMVS